MQLELLDTTPQATTYQRPAHVDPTKCGTSTQNYTLGCRCEECREYKNRYNHEYRRGNRICQHCGQAYPKGGGGTKFCNTCQLAGVYHRHSRSMQPMTEYVCPNCAHTWQTKQVINRWGLCARCMKKIQGPVATLKNHKVPLPIVLALLQDPTCPGCGRNLHDRINVQPQHHTRLALVVDHDHECCPGKTSCGKCVRGLLCHHCNTALGYARNNPTILRALADYLERQPPGADT
jgi:hypothetical protein